MENGAGGEANKVRYAVVGLGHIAQSAILPAFAHSRRNSKLTALVSDDAVKRRKLAQQYAAPATYSYREYERCLESGEVDAVYLALPNFLHRDYAVVAAEQAVHVLCEKPLAVTEEECEEMIQAARDHGVSLMPAYRSHFEKANLQAVEVVRSGQIGNPRVFHSVFTMRVREGNVRLQSEERGGGPLFDIGMDSINAARHIFRAEPVEVVAARTSSGQKRFREVAETAGGILRFPSGRLASFACSFGASDTGWYQVIGTEGDLRVDPAFETAERLAHRLTIGGRSRERVFPRRDPIAAEILYFSDCVLRGRSPEPSGREGLADVRIIRGLIRSAETGAAVALPAFDRARRPRPEQEIDRPPVLEAPELVHAESPSER